MKEAAPVRPVPRRRNLVGENVVKFRCQRRWTQDDLVAKLQLLGCCMTRDILANIETRRSIVTDTQMVFFAHIFQIEMAELFPAKGRLDGQVVGLDQAVATRKRCRRRRARRKKSS